MSDAPIQPENRRPYPDAASRNWREDDPYGQAFGPASDPKKAKGRLLVPGVLIVVLGILNLVPGVGCISFGMVMQSIPDAELEKGMNDWDSKQAKEAEKNGMGVEWVKKFYLYAGLGSSIFSLLVAVAALIGGGCLIAGRSMFLCGVGAFAAMLSPGGCGVLGLGVGIWALMVLFSEDVRAAFRAA